jgi:hypothetical protein
LILVGGLALFAIFSLENGGAISPNSVRSAYYQVPNLSKGLPAEILAVPIEIFIIDGEREKVSYSSEDMIRIVNSVNEIWISNANITFEIIEISRIVVPDNRAGPARSNADLEALGTDFLGEKFFDCVIDVVIVKSLKDQRDGGGIAHSSFKAVMENEFEDENRANWNLAHELGHKLNLFDVFQHDNLMQEEYFWNVWYKERYLPTQLTKEQVLTTRNWVYQDYYSQGPCNRND